MLEFKDIKLDSESHEPLKFKRITEVIPNPSLDGTMRGTRQRQIESEENVLQNQFDDEVDLVANHEEEFPEKFEVLVQALIEYVKGDLGLAIQILIKGFPYIKNYPQIARIFLVANKSEIVVQLLQESFSRMELPTIGRNFTILKDQMSDYQELIAILHQRISNDTQDDSETTQSKKRELSELEESLLTEWTTYSKLANHYLRLWPSLRTKVKPDPKEVQKSFNRYYAEDKQAFNEIAQTIQDIFWQLSELNRYYNS